MLIERGDIAEYRSIQDLKSRGNLRKPGIISGSEESYRFFDDFKFERLSSLRGKDVRMEQNNFLHTNPTFSMVPIEEYISAISKGETFEKDGREFYLSVYNIFKDFPHLVPDDMVRDVRKLKGLVEPLCWIGPKGTVTGLHADWPDNFLCQVQGRKRVMLIAPETAREMKLSDRFDPETTVYDYDIDTVDDPRMPKQFWNAATILVIEEGDILYIPQNWVHWVAGLSPTVSINLFFQTPLERMRFRAIEVLQRLSSALGVAYRENTRKAKQV